MEMKFPQQSNLIQKQDTLLYMNSKPYELAAGGGGYEGNVISAGYPDLAILIARKVS
jgi:hypothetical protein